MPLPTAREVIDEPIARASKQETGLRGIDRSSVIVKRAGRR